VALAPASDGNIWVVGYFGAYVKATPSLERADPYGPWDRIIAKYESFEHWRRYSDSYVEHEWFQKLSLPIAFLLLPTLLLIAAAAWRLRRRGSAWRYLAHAATLYLVAAIVVVMPFWKMTKHL